MGVKRDLRSSIWIDMGERREIWFGDDEKTKPDALTQLFVFVRTRDEHSYNMDL